MVRDLAAARRYVFLDETEEKYLLSRERPIVLLRKREPFEEVAPGLSNVGIYLPYSGLHHIIFHYLLRTDALISTSANLPGEPMLIENEHAFGLPGDCYLLHERKIYQRVDDSVLRLRGGAPLFLRRSRGYTPTDIPVKYKAKVLAVGAELSLACAVAYRQRLYQTQYLGNAERYGVLEFAENSINHLFTLLGIRELDAVAIDRHPRYCTRRLGRVFAARYCAALYEIQHHWAHAAALLLDRGLESCVALTLDGVGYGEDGTIWGGEVLRADFREYTRAGSLSEFPLPGGDVAVRDPRRVVFAIFDALGEELYFQDSHAENLRRLARASPRTSSFGRVLDALSCYLGICQKRTYEGEPAMKLEPYLERGEKKYELTVQIKDGKVDVYDIFAQLHALRARGAATRKADLAYSFVHALLEGLVELASAACEKYGERRIGLTGGVAYNAPITAIVERLVRAKGYEFVYHTRVACGDNGIALGQNAIAGELHENA